MANMSYEVIQSRIRKLQSQADKVKEKTRYPVILGILKSMHEYGISMEDIKIAESKPRRGPGRPRKGHMYRNPHTGQVWSGRGRRPQWFQDEIDKGEDKDKFKVM